MGLIALSLAIAAAYRMRDTPLAATVVVFAAVQALAWVAILVLERRGRMAPRPLTALHHVCAGMAGFFLFVSFAMVSPQ
ncbi:MAG TPA: hypothetical protein VEL28_08325 [Candidatus Binatia bacterium]|nr:hypothetical protein [Candidatus Binatia bacterium]